MGMTIKEFREKKVQAAFEILQILAQLQNDTGLKVEDVRIRHIDATDHSGPIYLINQVEILLVV
jgi:hypothetical protein